MDTKNIEKKLDKIIELLESITSQADDIYWTKSAVDEVNSTLENLKSTADSILEGMPPKDD